MMEEKLKSINEGNESRFFHSKDIKGLLEMGKAGYFPLFYPKWLEKMNDVKPAKKKTSKKDNRKINEIIRKLSKYDSLDKKRTVLMSLPDVERNLFVSAFLVMVEGKILDSKPSLQ
jgi:hypothetical protein